MFFATYTIMPIIISTRIANLLMYCWISLLPNFLAITKLVGIGGQNIGIKLGIFIISILGFGIPGKVPFGKILCFICQMIDMGTGGSAFTILGLGIPGFVEISRCSTSNSRFVGEYQNFDVCRSFCPCDFQTKPPCSWCYMYLCSDGIPY